MLKIRKLMDEGPQHPIVARLGIGIYDLLQFTTLPSEKRDDLSACAVEAMERLVRADAVVREVLAELREIEEQVLKEGGLRAQPGAVTLPSALKLHKAGEFLMAGKRISQTAIAVFDAVWDKKFGATRWDKARDWAVVALGPLHPISKLLVEDQPWIAHLIEMRNEQEHPRSTKPFISNYEANVQPGGKVEIIRPTFYDGSDVMTCLESYNSNRSPSSRRCWRWLSARGSCRAWR